MYRDLDHGAITLADPLADQGGGHDQKNEQDPAPRAVPHAEDPGEERSEQVELHLDFERPGDGADRVPSAVDRRMRVRQTREEARPDVRDPRAFESDQPARQQKQIDEVRRLQPNQSAAVVPRQRRGRLVGHPALRERKHQDEAADHEEQLHAEEALRDYVVEQVLEGVAMGRA